MRRNAAAGLDLALRTLWHCWQNGTRLNFRGKYYKLTLSSPFFDPGPIGHPDIPICTAGVGRPLCRIAGEVANGFLLHPFHIPRYMDRHFDYWRTVTGRL